MFGHITYNNKYCISHRLAATVCRGRWIIISAAASLERGGWNGVDEINNNVMIKKKKNHFFISFLSNSFPPKPYTLLSVVSTNQLESVTNYTHTHRHLTLLTDRQDDGEKCSLSVRFYIVLNWKKKIMNSTTYQGTTPTPLNYIIIPRLLQTHDHSTPSMNLLSTDNIRYE